MNVEQISVIGFSEEKELEYIYYQNGTSNFYRLEKLASGDVAQLLKELTNENGK